MAAGGVVEGMGVKSDAGRSNFDSVADDLEKVITDALGDAVNNTLDNTLDQSQALGGGTGEDSASVGNIVYRYGS